VAEEHPYRDLVLALLRELGPVGGDGFVHVDQTAVGESMRGGRGHPLGGRVRADDRVALPGARPGGVGPASPEVDDLAPVDVRAHRRAELALLEAACERTGDRLETGLDRPVDSGVRHDAVRLLTRVITHSVPMAQQYGLSRVVGRSHRAALP
jgi:hypothetical protein